VTSAIFVTVRTGSSRLPRKALLAIAGKPTIQHVIDRAKRSRRADLVVVCTTDLPEDDVLCDIAQESGVACFRGSTDDKLDRWLGAARTFGVDFFVTADGDDLFCDPELVDRAFEQYARTGADFIEGTDIPIGAFTYGISTRALERVCEMKATDDTEMMWVYFKDTGLFAVEELGVVDDVFRRPEIRMTLDYPDDLKFFKRIIQELGSLKPVFSLRDVISFLDEHPDVVAINQYLTETWAKNQQSKTQLVLKDGFKREAQR
jgi:spore coat polysaccharide biosynthesis protein SpsF